MEQKEENISLLPYIIYHEKSKEYTAYIKYKTINKDIMEHAVGAYNIAEVLGLPTDRSKYSPSYTYAYDDTTYEIGIIGDELKKIFESIKNIQTKLVSKNCIVDDNLDKIRVEW